VIDYWQHQKEKGFQIHQLVDTIGKRNKFNKLGYRVVDVKYSDEYLKRQESFKNKRILCFHSPTKYRIHSQTYS
jgi:hypothetical protein